MAKNSVLYNIYADLTNAIKTVVGAKAIFLKDRPNISDADIQMPRFAVIDLPVDIEDYVIGMKKTILNTSGVFYLFTQSRSNGTLDVNSAGELADSVIGLFPIVGECCTAANPVLRMRGSDGQGFQVTTITFDLQTKWRAFG